MSRTHRPVRIAVAAATVVALLAAGCGNDDDTATSDTTASASTTTTGGTPTSSSAPATSTTTGSPSTTPTAEREPVAVDPSWQRYEERWLVTGVAADDTLNVRRGPGVEHPVVHELAPDADDVEVFDVVELVDGASWAPVAIPGGAGWVNLALLRPPGSNPPQVVGDVVPAAETAADDVQAALGGGDHQRLASFVDERGVRFSTDAFVGEDDPVLTADQVAGAAQDDDVILWGYTDGQGMPIEMTIGERLRQIGRDYALASTDVRAFDTRVGTSNTLDNLDEVFPGAAVVEYHFDGTSLHGDFDWSSVRFVFDTSTDGRPALLAIVQDGWTI